MPGRLIHNMAFNLEFHTKIIDSLTYALSLCEGLIESYSNSIQIPNLMDKGSSINYVSTSEGGRGLQNADGC